jgi:hypothetical protein
MVNKMSERMPDLVILPAHDPGAADWLAKANGQTSVTLAGSTDTPPTAHLAPHPCREKK